MTITPTDQTTRAFRERHGYDRADIPEYVVVAEMDRARRVAEDALRIHGTLAAELGYERVRIEQIEVGDVIAGAGWHEVGRRESQVDVDGFDHGWLVTFTGADGTERFDPGQFVSRQLPLPENEPF